MSLYHAASSRNEYKNGINDFLPVSRIWLLLLRFKLPMPEQNQFTCGDRHVLIEVTCRGDAHDTSDGSQALEVLESEMSCMLPDKGSFDSIASRKELRNSQVDT